MKNFLLGVGATLAALALVLVVLVFSLGSGATSAAGSTAAPAPSGVGHRRAQPADLTEDETWLGAVELRSQDVVSAKGNLVDVVATGSGVRFSQEGLRAQSARHRRHDPVRDGRRASGQGRHGLRRRQRQDRRRAQVTILGRDITLKATGTVTADGGSCSSSLRPSTSVARRSSTRPRARWPAVSRRSGRTFRGCRRDVADAVQVTPQGFDAQLSGTDVVVGR